MSILQLFRVFVFNKFTIYIEISSRLIDDNSRSNSFLMVVTQNKLHKFYYVSTKNVFQM